MDPKWKRFERLAYEIQLDLAADAQVTLDDRLQGQDSGVERQIDISIRRRVAQYDILVVIDCKDHSTPVDLKSVEEFIGLTKDVRANKGALISSKGFTESAMTLARRRGVDTFRLIDTEAVDWQAYASAPVLLHRIAFGGYRLILSNFSTLPVAVATTDLPTANLYSLDGDRLGTVASRIARAWNAGQVPAVPGRHDVPLGKQLFLELGEERVQVDIIARIHVHQEFYLGDIRLHLKGLQNTQTAGVITREIYTDAISPSQIAQGLEPGWTKVDAPDQLAVELLMELACRDALPE